MKYSFENEQIVIEDPELQISFCEKFSPLRIKPDLRKDQTMPDGSKFSLILSAEGDLEEAFFEKEGQFIGEYLLFYPNKNRKMQSFYVNHVLHGPSTFYHDCGNVLSMSWFINGVRQGKCEGYYPWGSLCSMQQFKDNLQHGRQVYYYSNGKVKTLMHYDYGKLNGQVVLYAENGQIERELNYVNGVRQ
jgi:antitoxin component YwqK of YwqJK toxin-antitoxin module